MRGSDSYEIPSKAVMICTAAEWKFCAGVLSQGDVNAISRVHTYLESIGAINTGLAPQSMYTPPKEFRKDGKKAKTESRAAAGQRKRRVPDSARGDVSKDDETCSARSDFPPSSSLHPHFPSPRIAALTPPPNSSRLLTHPHPRPSRILTATFASTGTAHPPKRRRAAERAETGLPR